MTGVQLAMRRPRIAVVDVLLGVLVLTWALNIVTARYMVTHGFAPLVYASLRYVGGGLLLASITRAHEGKFRAKSGVPLRLLIFAGALFAANQVSFVYALKLTNASTAALIFGAAPIATALFASAVRTERMTLRFTVAATVSLAGVGLIALSAGAGGFSTDFKGVLLAIFMMASWSLYTVVTAYLMTWESAARISSFTFLFSGMILLVLAIPQFTTQNWNLEPQLWALLVFATMTLLITNVLYLLAMDRVGPSHAALYSNFQPFVGVLLAVLLLGETLDRLDVLGGIAIAAAMAISWGHRKPVPPATAE